VEVLLLASLLAAGKAEAAEMRQRLAGWLPAFAGRCAAGDGSGFYAALAALLQAFLAELAAERPRAEIPDRA
jgi:TorA maturation chaperone TorD